MKNIIFALVFMVTISFGYEPSKEQIKLASEGNVAMQNFVALSYAHKKDYKKAFFWYEKAAMQQNDFAQYNLAKIYYNEKKDYQKAFFWYEKAAMQQYELAQYNLANMYYDLKKDYGKAFFWYEKAANNGHELAQIKLLNSYKYGDKGVVKDLEISNYWNERFDSTSRLNYIFNKPTNPEEQFNVGVNSFNKKNYAYALYLFKDAARLGHRDSQHNLGVMFYYGIGVLKDIDVASYWLEKAANQGDNEAKELLKDINELNIKEAKKNARITARKELENDKNNYFLDKQEDIKRLLFNTYFEIISKSKTINVFNYHVYEIAPEDLSNRFIKDVYHDDGEIGQNEKATVELLNDTKSRIKSLIGAKIISGEVAIAHPTMNTFILLKDGRVCFTSFLDSPECYHDYRKDDAQLFAAVDSNLIKKFSTVDRYFKNMYITELEIRPKSKLEAKTIVKNQIAIRINSATITKVFNEKQFDFGFKDVDVEIVDKVTGEKVENLTAVFKYMDENGQLISKNIVQ